MGYESQAKESNITLYSDLQANLTFPLAAATQTLPSIDIPSDLIGSIKHAYLTIRAAWIYADAVGSDLDGDQYAQISVGGGALSNAILFPNNNLYVPSAVNWTSPFIFSGNFNLASAIDKGDTVDIQITNAKAASGFLRVYNVQCVLELYMG